MFTGIIEALGQVVAIEDGNGGVRRLTVASPLSSELRIDQSLAHDGVCLTVVAQSGGHHAVDVIPETLRRSRFDQVGTGDTVNLERAVTANARLDGHIVQGHVDAVGQCSAIDDGYYSFVYPEEYAPLIVEKGSICINGVSLTVAGCSEGLVTVALIPYTLEHTNFGSLQVGDNANLEFDILGKYVQKHLQHYSNRQEPERIVL